MKFLMNPPIPDYLPYDYEAIYIIYIILSVVSYIILIWNTQAIINKLEEIKEILKENLKNE